MSPMIHLMVVPAQLIADVASGAAYVAGALVKDGATHQVLAHLQPTRRLSEGLFSAMAKGPLAPVELLMEAGQSVQLMNIEKICVGAVQAENHAAKPGAP